MLLRDSTILVKEHNPEVMSEMTEIIRFDTAHPAPKRIISTGNDSLPFIRTGVQNAFAISVADSNSLAIVDSIPPVMIENIGIKKKFENDGEAIPHSYKTDDGITSLFLVSFILLASVCGRGLDFLQQMFRNLSVTIDRESIFVNNTTISEFKFKAFLLTQTSILLAVFLFVIYSIDNPGILYKGKDVFIYIVLFAVVIFLFWGIKWLFNTILGKIFFDSKIVSIWQNNYFSIIELSGIILFPVLLLMVSAQYEGLLFICIYLVLLIISVGFMLIIYKGFRIFLTNLYGIFYFILYLCALEFLPYTGLYMGLKYIYKTVELSKLWV